MATITISQILLLKNPNPNPKFLSTKINFNPKNPQFLPRKIPKSTFTLKVSASQSPKTLTSPAPLQQQQSLLTGSTRTVTTLFAVSLTLLKSLFHKFQLHGIATQPLSFAGPLFFAALRGRPLGSLSTPLTVVAAGLSKWLDIYSAVLMVRVLLSWFPNVSWDKQPLSAIRDLCDPYLNLFRNIIPPVFNTLDISPLLAFAVLGVITQILNGAKTI